MRGQVRNLQWLFTATFMVRLAAGGRPLRGARDAYFRASANPGIWDIFSQRTSSAASAFVNAGTEADGAASAPLAAKRVCSSGL